MNGRIEVWREGRHVGQFVVAADGVSFDYDEGASATPISLSLPRDRPAKKKAAFNFLANLLPEQERTRARMASVYGAASAGVFDLIHAAGGDMAGGLVLLPEDQEPTKRASEISPAADQDIAKRVAAIKRDDSDTTPAGVPARFLLAGAQGKFALSLVEDDWYWPNESVPSTHIVKPGSPTYRGIEAAEAAAMNLAKRAGLSVAAAGVETFADQSAYVVRRFDREPSVGPLAARVHMEDLAQSLGRSPEGKYDVTAREVVSLLRTIDTGGGVTSEFLRQLAFNVIVGNADAHAKNYSLYLRPDGVAMTPLYDLVPVFLFPEVDQRLSMAIGGARSAKAVTPNHWRKFAQSVGLDVDEVLSLVREVAGAIGEACSGDNIWAALDPDQQRVATQYVARSVERSLQPIR